MTEQHDLSDEESKDDPMSGNFDISSGGKLQVTINIQVYQILIPFLPSTV